MLDPHWQWTLHHKIFARVGADIFIASSPGGNIVYVAHTEAITQISTRIKDFYKPPGLSAIVDIYGHNVLSANGSEWRRFRKILSPQFNEENNELVWRETLDQTQSLLKIWLGRQMDATTGQTVAREVMQLSLHIISKAGFGVRMTWRDKEEHETIPAGHSVSYHDALEGILKNIYWVALLPRWLLSNSPFRWQRDALHYKIEWGTYMRELYESKKLGSELSGCGGGMDLMGMLTRDMSSSKTSTPESLSVSEILGNTFILLLAGHETVANSILCSLLYLAIHPQQQRLLQKDIDDIFADRPMSSWDFQTDMPKLSSGMAGAVLNEELRLMAPLPFLLKRSGDDQILSIEGANYTLQRKSPIMLCTAAAHRNPAYWPSNDMENPHDDLENFRPERWLDSKDSSLLYQPHRNTYFPFGSGPRSCPGRRFAQTEVMAALAIIFKDYNVELAVGDLVAEAELKSLGTADRNNQWELAAQKARDKMRDVRQVLTLRMKDEEIPVRFVKRGKEPS